jgi:adenylate cyclase
MLRPARIVPMSGPTAREIERKFLVDEPPGRLERFPNEKIRQGYLAVADDGAEVRVRRESGRCLLTIKSGQGVVRAEHETEISPSLLAALWPLTRGRRIRKIRYVVPHDGRMIQVDLYRRKLTGLIVAEVEFPDEDAARRFRAPAWLGREITGDAAYRNQSLAVRGLPGSTDRR